MMKELKRSERPVLTFLRLFFVYKLWRGKEFLRLVVLLELLPHWRKKCWMGKRVNVGTLEPCDLHRLFGGQPVRIRQGLVSIFSLAHALPIPVSLSKCATRASLVWLWHRRTGSGSTDGADRSFWSKAAASMNAFSARGRIASWRS
jgi:hypothetical protein